MRRFGLRKSSNERKEMVIEGVPVTTLSLGVLIDLDTGREVSDEEVERAFRELTATGICVKESPWRNDLPETWPPFGTIVGKDEKNVALEFEGSIHEVPVKDFHNYYVLD